MRFVLEINFIYYYRCIFNNNKSRIKYYFLNFNISGVRGAENLLYYYLFTIKFIRTHLKYILCFIVTSF